jgi:2-phospho-L-lactate guanylyltransferase
MLVDESSIIPIIPMKPLADCKTRLSRTLTAEERGDLVIGMLRRVIMAIKGASIDVFWVVGGDWRIRNLTRNFDGIWIEDFGRNLNDTVDKSFDRASQRGYGSMYLPGDLPFLKPADITSMIRSTGQGRNIVLAPARRDSGTNGILIPPKLAFKPELGNRSFTKHLSQAGKLGISVAICYSEGLGFDLDITEDLQFFQQREPGLLERLTPQKNPSPMTEFPNLRGEGDPTAI